MHFRKIPLMLGWDTDGCRDRLEAERLTLKLLGLSRREMTKVWATLQTLELWKPSVWEIGSELGPLVQAAT